jgi:hypothetical protein
MLYNISYYTQQSELTTPGEHIAQFANLPADIAELCRIVRGLVLHYFNEAASKDRFEELNLRHVKNMLTRILELDNRPLAEIRPPEKRLIGCCRDFALLFCAMARHQGIPSRVRVGFSAYFNPDFNHDHVVAEYWDFAEQRWRLVDAVLSSRHLEKYGIPFDRYDIPRHQFIPGGLAWQLCRSGQAEPDKFGFKPETKLKGWWFIRDKLVQDLAALNKQELLLWDYWGITLRELTDEDRDLLDRVALVTQKDNADFDHLRSLYDSEADLKIPSIIQSYRMGDPEPFEVSLGSTENTA